jgi:hypothetical protein
MNSLSAKLALCVALMGGSLANAAPEQPSAQPKQPANKSLAPAAQQSTGTATPQPQPAQHSIPAPFVSAKTNMVSSKTVTEPGLTIGGLTLTQSQPQREMSVTVSVQFFSPLPGPFEVQCFFFAKSETTKTHYIFNVVQEESKRPTYAGEIHSGTLLGATENWVGIPFSLPASLPDNGGKVVEASGKAVTSDTKVGSKIEGWVLRVVYEGRVLKVDANQPNLAELANRLPELFDETAKGK